MAGRFAGLNDLEWKLFEDMFPEEAKKGKGMPHVPYRYAIDSLLYILITGCRWCDTKSALITPRLPGDWKSRLHKQSLPSQTPRKRG
jgi:hypothetical protein